MSSSIRSTTASNSLSPTHSALRQLYPDSPQGEPTPKGLSHEGTILNTFKNLHNDERGQGMTEYVIILVAIAVVCIAIAVQFGGKIQVERSSRPPTPSLRRSTTASRR